MIQKTVKFLNYTTTQYYFDASFSDVQKITPLNNAIIVTDENVYTLYKKKLAKYKTIVLKPAGEKLKTQQVVDELIKQLINKKADKTTYLIALGGGTVTDLVGYVASIYMRGMCVGFIPTTLLAMVDAAVGGKNGINVDNYKNSIGTTRQPNFVLYDYHFLKTLSKPVWIDGFSEIIKHACIKDAAMFQLLSKHTIDSFQKNKKKLAALIQNNTLLKLRITQKDALEKNERYLLNFGHTIGHAIERVHNISHGQAVAVGIAIDCKIAEKYFGFTQAQKVISLLQQYELPTQFNYDKKILANNFKMDKKKTHHTIQYIFLEKIGKAYTKAIGINDLVKWL